MRERASAILAAVLLCVVALAAQTPGPATPPAGAPPAGPPQGPPPKPKNLKILPSDIDHDQLIAIMRGFSGALGVRCTHCHVGQEGDLRSMDFASDDKDEKKSARDMLKMTEAINGDYIAKISGNDPTANVMCVTCHRGQKHPPRPLDAVLSETVAKEGVDAAVAKYKQLRSEALDAGIYDFRDMMLLSVARRLREEKKADQSLALVRSTVDLFPNSANAAAALGMALLDSGDLAGAKTQFDRALQIDPKNGAAQQGLKRLEGPPAAKP
jgi:Photosynthetic reaction centre cytochrome C subunit/Tetratricopeptide repeat